MTCDNCFFDNPDFTNFQKLLFEGIQLAVQLATAKDTREIEPVSDEPKLVRQNTKTKLSVRNSSIKVRHYTFDPTRLSVHF